MKDYQKVLLLAAHLFEYPDAAWWADLEDCRKAQREIENAQASSVFGDFLDFVEETGAKEYEDLYVRSFDFSQNTNLYLTTQERTDFGKQSQARCSAPSGRASSSCASASSMQSCRTRSCSTSS